MNFEQLLSPWLSHENAMERIYQTGRGQLIWKPQRVYSIWLLKVWIKLNWTAAINWCKGEGEISGAYAWPIILLATIFLLLCTNHGVCLLTNYWPITNLIAAVQFSLIQKFRLSDFQMIKSNRLTVLLLGGDVRRVFEIDFYGNPLKSCQWSHNWLKPRFFHRNKIFRCLPPNLLFLDILPPKLLWADNF